MKKFLMIIVVTGIIFTLFSCTSNQKNAKETQEDNQTQAGNQNEIKTPVLKYVATVNNSTIRNFYASGSTITTTDEKITIDLDQNETSCGFCWDISETNIKSNTKYLIKFENISVTNMPDNSIRFNIQWQDSTYEGLRNYNFDKKQFDILGRGPVPDDYYQFLTSKTYDSYTIEFEFLTSSIEYSEVKVLYFDFDGVEEQLLIGKLSIYEVIYE